MKLCRVCGYNIPRVIIMCTNANSSSGQGQEDATVMCWSLPCCILWFALSVPQALQLYFFSVRTCKIKDGEEYCSSFLYFFDTRSTGLKKTKSLTLTIHKFCRNRNPGSEAAGVKEYKVHHLLTLALKGECQRQILLVRTECPREVSGSRSFPAWIR